MHFCAAASPHSPHSRRSLGVLLVELVVERGGLPFPELSAEDVRTCLREDRVPGTLLERKDAVDRRVW
jgi:hypothetical protein